MFFLGEADTSSDDEDDDTDTDADQDTHKITDTKTEAAAAAAGPKLNLIDNVDDAIDINFSTQSVWSNHKCEATIVVTRLAVSIMSLEEELFMPVLKKPKHGGNNNNNNNNNALSNATANSSTTLNNNNNTNTKTEVALKRLVTVGVYGIFSNFHMTPRNKDIVADFNVGCIRVFDDRQGQFFHCGNMDPDDWMRETDSGLLLLLKTIPKTDLALSLSVQSCTVTSIMSAAVAGVSVDGHSCSGSGIGGSGGGDVKKTGNSGAVGSYLHSNEKTFTSVHTSQQKSWQSNSGSESNSSTATNVHFSPSPLSSATHDHQHIIISCNCAPMQVSWNTTFVFSLMQAYTEICHLNTQRERDIRVLFPRHRLFASSKNDAARVSQNWDKNQVLRHRPSHTANTSSVSGSTSSTTKTAVAGVDSVSIKFSVDFVSQGIMMSIPSLQQELLHHHQSQQQSHVQAQQESPATTPTVVSCLCVHVGNISIQTGDFIQVMSPLKSKNSSDNDNTNDRSDGKPLDDFSKTFSDKNLHNSDDSGKNSSTSTSIFFSFKIS